MLPDVIFYRVKSNKFDFGWSSAPDSAGETGWIQEVPLLKRRRGGRRKRKGKTEGKEEKEKQEGRRGEKGGEEEKGEGIRVGGKGCLLVLRRDGRPCSSIL